MGRKKKPGLTRRMKTLYNAILSSNEHTISSYMYAYSNWKWWGIHSPVVTGWAALYFARQWHSRDIDIKKLQRIVILSGDGKCAYEFARDIPEANIRKLQDVVAAGLDPKALRLFMSLPGADKEYLESILIVSEVMNF